jgi:hypothetical protein
MFESSISHESFGASQAVERGVRKWMKDGATAGFNFSQEVVPQDRGTLLQSGVPPQFQADGSIVWGYNAEYAPYMEFGTEPGHTPPVQPLVEWAERVADDPGLGYYVATEKIPSEGVSEQPYARPGAEQQKRWYQSHSASSYIEDQL